MQVLRVLPGSRAVVEVTAWPCKGLCRAAWLKWARPTYFHKPKAHAQEALHCLSILVKARCKPCMQCQAVQAHTQEWDSA